MDDMDMFNEKQSIRDSARSLKKYGSTCNHIRNSSSEVLIRHEIEKTDTLQGISLKYGCTMEQIRRANRLFASDSLFLRQYLLIPVEKSSPYYPKDDRPQSLPVRAFSVAGTEFESTNQNLLVQLQNSTSSVNSVQNYNNNQNINCNNNSTNSSCRSIESIMSPEEENKRSIDEFLGKIDTTIAESKKYVAKSQHGSNDMITSQSDDDLFSSNYQGGNIGGNSNNGTKRYHYQQSSSASTSCSSSNHHTRHSSSGSTSDTAHLLNLNQGKRVQNSLQRLEKEQDEFFEL
ncbi:lysM and putative peptidoglycan-binding domain-containing protein 1 isoform X2 [Condylostylus longicornis]|nr:lysM and putative peptidoglycan-binding domain-containing protein 1 isoform X2 [Condylostylus longicornis]